MAEELKKYLDYEGLQEYHKKLKSNLDDMIGDLDVATEDKPGLVQPSDGLEVDETGKTKVKPKEDGAITVTEDGIDVDWSKGQKAGSSTLGMVKVGDGLDITEEGVLSVKPKTNSGLAVDSEGVSLAIKETNSGLSVGADGLGVNLKSNGGITSSVNGLAVEWEVAPKADSDTYGMVKIGEGFSTDEDGTLSFDPDSMASESIPLDKIEGSDDLLKKSDMTDVYEFKGSVETIEDLQEKEDGAKVGDVYNVKSTGMNYGYVESGGDYNEHWDALGGTFAIESISISEIDALFAADDEA